jgi:hypothetical protein
VSTISSAPKPWFCECLKCLKCAKVPKVQESFHSNIWTMKMKISETSFHYLTTVPCIYLNRQHTLTLGTVGTLAHFRHLPLSTTAVCRTFSCRVTCDHPALLPKAYCISPIFSDIGPLMITDAPIRVQDHAVGNLKNRTIYI